MAARRREDAPLVVGRALSVEEALRGARRPLRVRWAPGSRRRVERSAARIRRAVERGEWVYGVTTGFGSNAVKAISPRDAAELQENLLLSHAFGEGPPLPDEVVRLALLLRIHALALGASGVRPS